MQIVPCSAKIVSRRKEGQGERDGGLAETWGRGLFFFGFVLFLLKRGGCGSISVLGFFLFSV